jgi:hypothetical protein
MRAFTPALMRLTWLLPHEESGLTPIARKNIATASLMLAGLWLLDVLAWTGLWNMLLNGSLTALRPLTLAALLLGVVFATLILRYESTFFSCDFRKSLHPRI